MRAPQHIQPHSNFTFPVHSDKLSFESGKRPFYYFHGIAGSQRGAAHFHRFGTVIEHEAESVHLFVGDDGRGAFAAQYHIAADRLQAQGKVRDLKAQLALANQAARSDLQLAAQADITAAEAKLTHADWLVTQASPVSPVNARVEETIYQQGEWVPAGSPVITLLAADAVKIRFYIPETQFAGIHTGQTISVSCDGCNTTIPARISYIASEAEYTPPVIYSKENRAKLVFMAEAKPIDTAKLTLHPGQPVAVSLTQTE